MLVFQMMEVIIDDYLPADAVDWEPVIGRLNASRLVR
jgi:hypothetical protein